MERPFWYVFGAIALITGFAMGIALFAMGFSEKPIESNTVSCPYETVYENHIYLVFNGTGTAALHAEHCPCKSHAADFSR